MDAADHLAARIVAGARHTITREDAAMLIRAHADAQAFAAITASKIADALSLTRYAGSRLDAAEQILKGACIRRREVKKHVADPKDRKRLYALLNPE